MDAAYALFLATILLISCLKVQSSSIVKSTAGLIYINDDGVINCDELICPQGTCYCSVSKKSIPGTGTKMSISKVCTDCDGKVLAQHNAEGVAPFPNFEAYAQVDVFGNTISSGTGGNLTPEEQEALNRQLQAQLQQTQQHIQQVTANVQATVAQINQQMTATFQNMMNNMFG